MQCKRQQHILKKYRKIFPSQTLKEVSETTSINISRVFRLFNGYEMKVSEYERFEVAIGENINSADQQNFLFFDLAEKCNQHLSSDHMDSIIEEMKLRLLAQVPHLSGQIISQGEI